MKDAGFLFSSLLDLIELKANTERPRGSLTTLMLNRENSDASLLKKQENKSHRSPRLTPPNPPISAPSSSELTCRHLLLQKERQGP